MSASPGGACTVRVRRAQPEAEYSLQLQPGATLPALRAVLATASAVAPDQQRLIFRGAELGHVDVPLAALGVEHDSVLHLVARAQAPHQTAGGEAADSQGQQQQQQQQQQQRGTQAGAPLAQVIIGEIFNQLGQRLSPGPQVTFNAPPQQQQMPRQWPFPTGVPPQQQPGATQPLPEALVPMNAVQAYAQRLRDSHVGVGHFGAHHSLVIAGDGAVPLFGGATSDATPGPRHGGDGGPPGVVHGNVQCDGCGAMPIRHRRFKSLTQPDYDLCASCCASGRFAAQGPFTCLEQPIPLLVVADPPPHGGGPGAPAPRFPAPPADTASRVVQLAGVLDNTRDVVQTALPLLTRVTAALRVQGDLTQPAQRAEAQAVALQTAALLNAQGALSLELARLLGGLSFGRSPQDMALWQRGPVVFISQDGVQATSSGVGMASMPGVPPGAMGMPVQNVMAMLAQQQQAQAQAAQQQAMHQQMHQQMQQHMQQVQQQMMQQHMQQQQQQQPQQGPVPPGAGVPGSSFEWRINLGMQPPPPPDGGPQPQQAPPPPPPPGMPDAVIQVGVGVLPVPGAQPAPGPDGSVPGATSIAVPLPLGAIVQGVIQSLSAPGAASGGAGGIMRSAVQGALQALQQQQPGGDVATAAAAATGNDEPPALVGLVPLAPAPPGEPDAATSSDAAGSSAGPPATTFPTPPSSQSSGAARPRGSSSGTERARRPAPARSPFDLTRAFGSGGQPGTSPPQTGGDDVSMAPPSSALTGTAPQQPQSTPPAGLGSLLPPPRRAARRGGDGSDVASAPATPAGDSRTPSRGGGRAGRSGSSGGMAPAPSAPGSLGGMMAEMASSPAFHQFANQMLGSLSAGPGRNGSGGGPELTGGADLGNLVSMALGALGGGGMPGGPAGWRAQQRRLVPEAPWREELPVEEAQEWEDTIQADTALLATLTQPRQLSAAYAAYAGLDGRQQ